MKNISLYPLCSKGFKSCYYRVGIIVQWEREMMLERQKIGIAKAKSEGKYKGRVPTARKLEKEIQRLHLEGIKPSVIAKELNIGVASVYRYR